MSILRPEIEIVDRTAESVRYLQHGWITDLCRWHAHVEYELHFITCTSGTAFVGDYIGDFGPRSLFLTGPNVPHNWVSDASYGDDIAVRDKLVQFSHDSFVKMAEGFGEFNALLDMLNQSSRGIEFHDFDADLVESALDDCGSSRGMRRILPLMDLLVYLAEEAEIKPLSVVEFGRQGQGRMESQIGEAVDFVVSNFAEDISVGAVSKRVGLSETSFSRRFKELTGNRFTEFVNRVRVGEACARLQQTVDPVSAICYDVGFQNLANFNRHFLKMKGLTPTEYRNQMRQANGLQQQEH